MDALPFVGMDREGDFRGALREYREGLGSRASQFEGLRLDPYHGLLEAGITLKKCTPLGTYMGSNYPHSWSHSSKNQKILLAKNFFIEF